MARSCLLQARVVEPLPLLERPGVDADEGQVAVRVRHDLEGQGAEGVLRRWACASRRGRGGPDGVPRWHAPRADGADTRRRRRGGAGCPCSEARRRSGRGRSGGERPLPNGGAQDRRARAPRPPDRPRQRHPRGRRASRRAPRAGPRSSRASRRARAHARRSRPARHESRWPHASTSRRRPRTYRRRQWAR